VKNTTVLGMVLLCSLVILFSACASSANTSSVVSYHQATVRDFHLNLSEEFLIYLTSLADERTAIASLVKTIIGDNPPVKDKAVFLTVNGSPLKTEKNDFSARLSFDGVMLLDATTADESGATSTTNHLTAANDWARDGITSAIGKGFVPNDIQSAYTNTITRAEFCRMAVKWLEYKLGKSIDNIMAERDLINSQGTFSDTNDPAILAAYGPGT